MQATQLVASHMPNAAVAYAMSLLKLIESISCPVDCVAFERGIVLRPDRKKWFAHSPSGKLAVEVSPDQVAKTYRPVMVRYRTKGTSSTFDLMMRPQGGFVRLVQVLDATAFWYDLMTLQYLFGALVYHVSGLTSTYERVCIQSKEMQKVFGLTKGESALFGGQSEPYYEFDALLSGVRRSYDACRYPLWKCFGQTQGSIPSSLEKVLPRCSRLDEKTRADIEQSWQTCGKTITDYRDCIHHYVPLDFGNSSVAVEEVLPGIWSAMARIPDNPSSRSKRQFTFSKELDALTYGWHAAAEASRVLRLVVAAVERSSKTDKPNN